MQQDAPRRIPKPELDDRLRNRGHEPSQKEIPKRPYAMPGLVLFPNLRPNQRHGMMHGDVILAAGPLNCL